MPIGGTGAILGKAMLDARLAAAGAPTPPEDAYARMLAMTTAEATAILAHLEANALVLGVCPGGGGGPLVGGTIT